MIVTMFTVQTTGVSQIHPSQMFAMSLPFRAKHEKDNVQVQKDLQDCQQRQRCGRTLTPLSQGKWFESRWN
jgi:hypothetical protein